VGGPSVSATSPPEPAHHLGQLDARRPPPSTRRRADGRHGRRLAGAPDALSPCRPGTGGVIGRARRHHDVVGRGAPRRPRRRRCGQPAGRRPGPGRSRAASRFTRPPSVWLETMKLAPRQGGGDVDLGGGRASAFPCTASPGRSRLLDGMHAQYEHSPPTSSRSTTATRRPPSASAPAQCSPGASPMTITS
jgi:hypothetical protein